MVLQTSHPTAASVRERLGSLDAHEYVKRLHQAYGPQRLMWCTDWPVTETHAKYPQALKLVRDEMKFLNADNKQWLLSKTPERVWPFPA